MKHELIQARANLALARQGYDLLDKKRQLLHRELTHAKREATELQAAAAKAEQLAQTARALAVAEMSGADELLDMPYLQSNDGSPPYSLHHTTASLDEAYVRVQEARALANKYETIQSHVNQLAQRLNKTARRAAALQHRQIPLWQGRVRSIQAQLEEHARDELARVKMATSYCGGLR